MMKKIIIITNKEKKAFEDIFINSIDTCAPIHVNLDWNDGTIQFNNNTDFYNSVYNQYIYFEDFDIKTVTPEEMLQSFVDEFNFFASEISSSEIEYSIEMQ